MAHAPSRLRRLVSETVTSTDDPAATKQKLAPIDTERVRDISVQIYKARLGRKDTEEMIANDGHEKLRKRAAIYDALTIAYHTALGIEIPRVTVSLFGATKTESK